MISKKTISEIVNRANLREYVFWGYHKGMINELKSEGIDVKKIFTGNLDLLNESDYFLNYKLLKGQSRKYFVIFPIWPKEKHAQEFYTNILKEYGYYEKDWLSLAPVATQNIEKNEGFQDIYGNECSPLPERVKLIVEGYDNFIQILNIENTGNISIIIKGNNNIVVIDENVKFRGKNNKIHCMGDKTNIYIGKRVTINNIDIECFSNTVLHIGEDTTIADSNLFYMHPSSRITLGNNCKTSFNVLFQTGDGHSIFSVITGENINSSKKNLDKKGILAEIELGEHVWLCRESKVLSSNKKTTVGNGSIVGMGAIIKGIFPNNCAIAGVPGRVVKENIAWAAKNESDDIRDCKGYINLTKHENM